MAFSVRDIMIYAIVLHPIYYAIDSFVRCYKDSKIVPVSDDHKIKIDELIRLNFLFGCGYIFISLLFAGIIPFCITCESYSDDKICNACIAYLERLNWRKAD